MKWALFFCVLSLNAAGEPEIKRPLIIETFVSQQKCVEVLIEKGTLADDINKELGPQNSPAVFLSCLPNMGPWKTEVGL